MNQKSTNIIQITLTEPQSQFVFSEEQFPAFVGGYGSGKTAAALYRAMRLKLAYPKQDLAYYLPTYDLITRIAYPRFSEMFENIGIKYDINRNDAIFTVKNAGCIICRTMDRPEKIVGYEVGHSLVDEIDILKIDKAKDVWNKVIARNRQKLPDGKPNSVGCATTPEGFNFVYDRWVRQGGPRYQLIKASTMSNAHNLPPEYIQSLRESYPAQLLQAYLEGEFVNMTSGTVYVNFDRSLNATNATHRFGEPLHIGLDFNVGRMAAVVHVIRDGIPYAVDEITKVLDTPAMIVHIKRRYPNHRILVYPDASGRYTKSSNASESDIFLLKRAGFHVSVNPSNPFVRDRVLAFNQLLFKDNKRGYFVNPDTCPELVEALEKQSYDKHGDPDKSGGFDHINDAAGYFVVYKYPVKKRLMLVGQTSGTY